MSFIKTGDGKIVGVIDPNSLTLEEKSAVKQKVIKESEESTDASTKKKSGS